MKKLLLTTAAGLALSFGAMSAASADGLPRDTENCASPVCATVDFDKWTYVYELQLKLKFALVIVTSVHRTPYAAESNAVVWQRNENSSVLTNSNNLPGQNGSFGFKLTALIDDSVNDNRGIVQFNQDVGNSTNQMNVLSLAINRTGGFADSNASADQANYNSTVTSHNVIKDANITDSVNRNSGVTMVNQNAGNFNNQANVMSAAIAGQGANRAVLFDPVTGPKGTSSDPGVAILALSEADLGQSNRGNTVTETNNFVVGYKNEAITNSVNNNTGVTAVNQSVGNFNNQATVISLAGTARF